MMWFLVLAIIVAGFIVAVINLNTPIESRIKVYKVKDLPPNLHYNDIAEEFDK